jgi:hypothetical protein
MLGKESLFSAGIETDKLKLADELPKDNNPVKPNLAT